MENAEVLKEYLSEETYAKVLQETEGKEIKLANLKSGEYVSKDKYTALEGRASELQTQLASKATAYDELIKKAGDNDALKNELETLKTTAQSQLADTTKAYEAKLLNVAVKSEIIKAKARDAGDIIGQLKMDNIKLENDTLVGLSEQLEALKTSKPYLFEEEKTKGKSGIDHSGNGGENDEAEIRRVMGLPALK